MNKFWQKVKTYFRREHLREQKLGKQFEPIDTGTRAEWAFTIPITMIFISLLSLLVFVYAAIAILSDPDGLPGVIGRMLAGYCLSTGQCNFYNLLPSFAIALIILTDLVIYFMFLFIGFADEAIATQDDVEDVGAQLNDRLEKLRQDLLPDRNEFAWALDDIYNICNSDRNDPIKTICDIRKISGETMGYLEPADLDGCADAAGAPTTSDDVDQKKA